jgi:hypothetical protein
VKGENPPRLANESDRSTFGDGEADTLQRFLSSIVRKMDVLEDDLAVSHNEVFGVRVILDVELFVEKLEEFSEQAYRQREQGYR